MTDKKPEMRGLSTVENPAARIQELVQETAVGNMIARTHATTQASESESVLAFTRESKPAREQESEVAVTLTTLNTRIPAELNDWLDERAFKGKKRGVTKQQMVIDAIREYISRRIAEEGEG